MRLAAGWRPDARREAHSPGQHQTDDGHGVERHVGGDAGSQAPGAQGQNGQDHPEDEKPWELHQLEMGHAEDPDEGLENHPDNELVSGAYDRVEYLNQADQDKVTEILTIAERIYKTTDKDSHREMDSLLKKLIPEMDKFKTGTFETTDYKASDSAHEFDDEDEDDDLIEGKSRVDFSELLKQARILEKQ